MNNFRRNKKITDEEINAFKEAEINKLLEQTKKPTQNNWFKRPMILVSTFMLTTLIIVLSIFILNQPEDKLDYTVTKLSYNEYLIESKVNNNNFNLYYKTSVIQPGQRTTYNDTFEYYTPYTYASDDIAKQYEVEFNVFKLSQYRYFLEINFNNESTYLEVNYYAHHIISRPLVGLEIDDLEKDMSDIYELIDLYPPQFYEYNLSVPMYYRHPDIDLLEESKAKRNYIQYVENNLYAPDELKKQYEIYDDRIGDRTFTVLLRQMITVNEHGEYIDSEIYKNRGYGDDITFVEYLPDYAPGFFSFYLVGEDRPFEKHWEWINPHNDDISGYFGRQWDWINPHNSDVSGYYKIGSYNEKLYLYSYISLIESNIDLSEVHYGEIDYTLSAEFANLEGSNKFEFLDYDHGLIMPPLIISDDVDTRNVTEIFDNLTYRFYDINNTLIYEFTR